MNLDLNGKRALVGGSTNGIGWACARQLAELGASVTLMSRSPQRLAQRVAELPATKQQKHSTLAADFASTDGVRSAIEAHVADGDPYNIFVHNTGGPPEGRAIDCSADDYLAGFNAHLVCAQIITRALVPGMRTSGHGRIITITSTSAKAPIQPLGVSNVVRAAVANWVKSLSLDLGPDGITVNNVLPGFTKTNRLESLIESWAGKAGVSVDEWTRSREQTIPLRRFGEPEEVGAAVAFLASPAASYISGINLPVDGGRLPTL